MRPRQHTPARNDNMHAGTDHQAQALTCVFAATLTTTRHDDCQSLEQRPAAINAGKPILEAKQEIVKEKANTYQPTIQERMREACIVMADDIENFVNTSA